jgi:hypothetical protein
MRTLWLLVVEAADDISNERSPKHPTPRMCASRSGPDGLDLYQKRSGAAALSTSTKCAPPDRF